MTHLPVPIPTNQSFLKQWHPWILMKVSRKFKRDKERIQDAAQNVRLRLLQKDFIGRWFYKHLTDELVDRVQAQFILGGGSIEFNGSIQPVVTGPNPICNHRQCRGSRGCVRSCEHSLWRVSDLLNYAQFDYQRYYYSIQNHTIDSDSILKLLGYPAGSYGILESLYRQNRLRPSELTEHECIEILEPLPPKGSKCRFVDIKGVKCTRKHFSRGYCSAHYGRHILVPCPACIRGRELLKSRGLSLANRWTDPEVSQAASRLRWNDKQLRPFLRDWRRTNIVRATPLYIMRSPVKGVPPGVDAGLLKYAEMVIDHEVVNDFKRISRGDDMSMMIFNKGLSPEFGDSETVAWELDENEDPSQRQRIFRDGSSLVKFSEMESQKDLHAIMESAHLTLEESDVIQSLDLQEMNVRDYAMLNSKTVQRVNRVRASAMKKLRDHRTASSTGLDLDCIVYAVCGTYGCTLEEIVGPGTVGPCVLARMDLFCSLFDSGMNIGEISLRLMVPEDRVAAAINRRVLKDIRLSRNPLQT